MLCCRLAVSNKTIMQQAKNYNPLQEIDAITKLNKFHANETHKILSFTEIRKELKGLMKELSVYKSEMKVV